MATRSKEDVDKKLNEIMDLLRRVQSSATNLYDIENLKKDHDEDHEYGDDYGDEHEHKREHEHEHEHEHKLERDPSAERTKEIIDDTTSFSTRSSSTSSYSSSKSMRGRNKNKNKIKSKRGGGINKHSRDEMKTKTKSKSRSQSHSQSQKRSLGTRENSKGRESKSTSRSKPKPKRSPRRHSDSSNSFSLVQNKNNNRNSNNFDRDGNRLVDTYEIQEVVVDESSCNPWYFFTLFTTVSSTQSNEFDETPTTTAAKSKTKASEQQHRDDDEEYDDDDDVSISKSSRSSNDSSKHEDDDDSISRSTSRSESSETYLEKTKHKSRRDKEQNRHRHIRNRKMATTNDTVNGDEDDNFSYDTDADSHSHSRSQAYTRTPSRSRSFDNSYYDGGASQSQYTYSTYGDGTCTLQTAGSYDSRSSSRDNGTYFTNDRDDDFTERDLSYTSSRSSRSSPSPSRRHSRRGERQGHNEDNMSYSTRGDDSFSRATSAVSAYTKRSSSYDSYTTQWTTGNTTAVSCSDTYFTESTPAGFSTFGKKMPVTPSVQESLSSSSFDDHKENNMLRANRNSQDSERPKRRLFSRDRGWNDGKEMGFLKKKGQESYNEKPLDNVSVRSNFSVKSTGSVRSARKENSKLGNKLLLESSPDRPLVLKSALKSTNSKKSIAVAQSKESTKSNGTSGNGLRLSRRAKKDEEEGTGSGSRFSYGKVHVDYRNDSILKNFSKQNQSKVRDMKVKSVNYDNTAAPFYRALDTKQWKQATIRLRSHPEEAKIWVYRLDKNKEMVWKFLPLHAACFSGAPGELVKDIVKVYPEAARMTAYGDKLPIHIACETGASRDVVLCLVDAYPDSLCMTECHGNTPLELCKYGSNKNSAQLVKILTQPRKRRTVPRRKLGLFRRR